MANELERPILPNRARATALSPTLTRSEVGGGSLAGAGAQYAPTPPYADRCVSCIKCIPGRFVGPGIGRRYDFWPMSSAVYHAFMIPSTRIRPLYYALGLCIRPSKEAAYGGGGEAAGTSTAEFKY